MQTRILSTISLFLGIVVFVSECKGELVDTEGNVVTNQTALGDIDMAKGTMGDLKSAVTQGYAKTNYVDTSVSNLNYDISINTNFVRRSDRSIGFGTGNTLGNFSLAMGNDNVVGNRSTVFGFNNTLLSPSSGNSQQYAFGLGNRSQAPNNFIVGMGSGATSDGESSISLGTMSVSTNLGSFVWNWYPTDYSSVQADQIFDLFPKYYSHGDGSFNINPIGGIKGFWIGETNFEQHVLATVADPIAEAGEIVIDHMKQFVTNSTIVGYTDWRYTGNTSPSAVYSITMSDAGGGNYSFTLNDTISVTALGTVTTNTLNPTVLVYTSVGITASRDPIRRNNNGFAYNSDVQKLRVEMTNEVQTLRKDVEDMDTSYIHYNQITNVNQSVQYIVPATGQTTLEIKIPETGITKDWVIYVNTNEEQPLSLVLPPANYWVASEEVTNDIVTATALYFSQINSDTFSLGRKEMVPVTVSSTRVTTFSVSPSAKKSAAARRLSSMKSKGETKK